MLGGEWRLWVSMFHSSRYSSIYYRLKTQESGEEEGWINVFFFQRNLGCGLVCLIFAPLNSFLFRAKYCAKSLFWWLTDRRYLCKKGKKIFSTFMCRLVLEDDRFYEAFNLRTLCHTFLSWSIWRKISHKVIQLLLLFNADNVSALVQ